MKTKIFTAIAAALALSACHPHDHDGHDHESHDHAQYEAATPAAASAEREEHGHGHEAEHDGHDHDAHDHDAHDHDDHDHGGHDHDGHDHDAHDHDAHDHDAHDHDDHDHDDHDHDSHDHDAPGAHVHGEGQLTLIQEGHEVMIALTLPTDSLWGFERAPQNEQETAAVERVLDELSNGHRWFVLSSDAACQPEQARITPPAGLTDPEAAGHMELEAQWSWHCEGPVQSVNVLLFKQYPELHRLSLQRLTDAGSGGAELTTDTPTAKW